MPQAANSGAPDGASNASSDPFSAVLGVRRGRSAPPAHGEPATVCFQVAELDGGHVRYQVFRGDDSPDEVELAGQRTVPLVVGDHLRLAYTSSDPYETHDDWTVWVVTGDGRDAADFAVRGCRVSGTGATRVHAWCPHEECERTWPFGSMTPAKCPEHGLHVAFGGA